MPTEQVQWNSSVKVNNTMYISGELLATITLDGTGSRDPDGDSIAYRWYWTNMTNNMSDSSQDIINANR